LILAIDSSSLVASVAIVSEETIIAEYTVNLKKTHSQTLLPMIDEIFRMTGVNKKDLKAIAITGGPGSFTGLRIGAATAKGLALALGIGIINVPTINAMAYNYNHCNKLICPIMDARRNQVYTGVFRCENDTLETVMKQCAMSIDDLTDYLNERNEEVIFIGDGIPAFKQIIDEKLTAGHFYARQQLSRQRATTIGAIAWDMYRAGEIENADLFAPDYLRLSQAERERMERDKENGK